MTSARDTAWFALVTLSIAALLAVPDVSRITGAIFTKGDRHIGQAFHHWDYYAVGPALQVRAGRALGPQAYTEYRSAFPRSFLHDWTLSSRSATTIS